VLFQFSSNWQNTLDTFKSVFSNISEPALFVIYPDVATCHFEGKTDSGTGDNNSNSLDELIN
jgi:hypothetical protein